MFAKCEDALLVIILASLIGLAAGQIFLRNVFDFGVIWIEPLSRVLVMWLALIAAGIATREKAHLAIDVTQSLPGYVLKWLDRLTNVIAGCVCLAIAYYSVELVRFEYEDGLMAFDGVPVWLTEVIIPISFLLMGCRFILLLFLPHAKPERAPQ